MCWTIERENFLFHGRLTLKKITLIVLASLVTISAQVKATKPTPGFPFGWKFVPITDRCNGRNIVLGFTFHPKEDLISKVVATVEPMEGIVYNGPSSWTVNFQSRSDSTYRELSLTLPKNDTSKICVNLAYNGKVFPVHWYFVTEGDSVEYFAGDPRQRGGFKGYCTKKPTPEINPDTLKESDLNAEYEVYVDVSSPDKLAKAESVIGHTLSVDSKGRARIKLSLRTLYTLVHRGLKFQYSVPPPWSSQVRDSVRSKKQ
jgi:hypothetical protein